jgi:hypothetical protein
MNRNLDNHAGGLGGDGRLLLGDDISRRRQDRAPRPAFNRDLGGAHQDRPRL